MGFDFYAFTQREILVSDKDTQVTILRDQLVFWLILYFFILPLCFVIFPWGLLPSNLIIWFYIIVVSEHLSQELYRFFILLEKQLVANFLLFVRTALWVVVVLIYWLYLNFSNLDLEIVWLCWGAGSLTSVVIGIFILKRHYGKFILKPGVNWAWIRKGAQIAGPFFIGTIAYKVIEFSDRYMIDSLLGKSQVGIYTFYNSIVNVLQTIVYTLTIADMYPKLASHYLNAEGDFSLFNSYREKFSRAIMKISIIGTLLLIVAILPVVYFIKKQEFITNLPTYYILLLSVLMLNLSLIPNYILYAQKKDKAIMWITLAGALMNVIGNAILINVIGIMGAAISTCISYTFMYVAKKRMVSL